MIEHRDPLWSAVERHCRDEIETIHRQLEVIQPDTTTNQLRGEIRALRRVLQLGEAPAAPDPKTMIQPDTPGFA